MRHQAPKVASVKAASAADFKGCGVQAPCNLAVKVPHVTWTKIEQPTTVVRYVKNVEYKTVEIPATAEYKHVMMQAQISGDNCAPVRSPCAPVKNPCAPVTSPCDGGNGGGEVIPPEASEVPPMVSEMPPMASEVMGSEVMRPAYADIGNNYIRGCSQNGCRKGAINGGCQSNNCKTGAIDPAKACATWNCQKGPILHNIQQTSSVPMSYAYGAMSAPAYTGQTSYAQVY